MAKGKRGRPKQTELQVEGPGVSPVKYKDLDKLGDEFIEIRDKKAELAEEMTATTAAIVKAMHEHEIDIYRFGDQEIEIVSGKEKIKIKTVTAEGADGQDPDPD